MKEFILSFILQGLVRSTTLTHNLAVNLSTDDNVQNGLAGRFVTSGISSALWLDSTINIESFIATVTSCSSVLTAVSRNGPYVFEARADNPDVGSLHSTCSCTALRTEYCSPILEVVLDIGGVATKEVLTAFVPITLESSVGYTQSSMNAFLSTGGLSDLVRLDGTAIANHAGPGNRALGCCTDGSAEPTLASLIESQCLVPTASASALAGKWVALRRGGCSLSEKYKMAVASGARGVLLVDDGSGAPDHVTVFPGEAASLSIPVMMVPPSVGSPLLSLLGSASATVREGLYAGVSPGYEAQGGVNTTAGLRVYDLTRTRPGVLTQVGSGPVAIYSSLFDAAGGLVLWMETSAVRDVLFVCLGGTLQAYNISTPASGVPLLGVAPVACAKDSRDRHVVDSVATRTAPMGEPCPVAAEGTRYVTALLGEGNVAAYFETTRLDVTWFPLRSVLADWESAWGGLGGVAPSADGAWHAFSWRCGSEACGVANGDEVDWLRPPSLGCGPRSLQVPLDLEEVQFESDASQVRGSETAFLKTRLPLTRGSVVSAAACAGTSGLCAFGLSWDGLCVVDAGAGPSQFSVVATAHPTTPAVDLSSAPQQNLLAATPALRALAGVQRVFPSAALPSAWVYEFTPLDLDRVLAGATAPPPRRLVYLTSLTGYTRAALTATADPGQTWRGDLQCGAQYPAPNGQAATCPLANLSTIAAGLSATVLQTTPAAALQGTMACCNPALARCGSGGLYCACDGCVDFANLPPSSATRGPRAFSPFLAALIFWTAVAVILVSLAGSVACCCMQCRKRKAENGSSEPLNPQTTNGQRAIPVALYPLSPIDSAVITPMTIGNAEAAGTYPLRASVYTNEDDEDSHA